MGTIIAKGQTRLEANEPIILNGVTTHNLKNINVTFEENQLTVVMGVSGSGKSSLVFDTLYAESYHRYLQTIVTDTRHALGGIPRGQVQHTSNLPPAIAIRTRTKVTNLRSTVGSLSEISDYLRIYFALVGVQLCLEGCGPVEPSEPQELADKFFQLGKRITILGRLQVEKKSWKLIQAQLLSQGFQRLYVNGEFQKIAEIKSLKSSSSWLVMDRLTCSEEEPHRLVQAIRLAAKAGQGVIGLLTNDEDQPEQICVGLTCGSCLTHYTPLKPHMFHNQHPQGACKECQGFGRSPTIDRSKVINDLSKSLAQEGVACFNFGSHRRYITKAITAAGIRGLDADKPFAQYSDEDWQWLWQGGQGFIGIEGYFAYLDRKKYKKHIRIHQSRYLTYVKCEECQGSGSALRARMVAVQEKLFPLWFGCSIAEVNQWLPPEEPQEINALKELRQRLAHLIAVGLGYLGLGRRAIDLSGGEMQRVQMARSLGSSLEGVLYCLDEPSSGLHPADISRLCGVLAQLKQLGNTLVLVDHDQRLAGAADRVLKLGPQAGHRGGEVCATVEESDQGAELSWQGTAKNRVEPLGFFEVRNPRLHNLQGHSTPFGVGAINVVCGVSGSGKSSLVLGCLLPLLKKEESVEQENLVGLLDWPDELVGFHSVEHIGQDVLSKSSRSTVATYLGVFTEIRKVLASQPQAKERELDSRHFSFNSPGGRCEVCRGLGQVDEDLGFLGMIVARCQACQGRRFTQEVLEVRYRGVDLLGILAMTVDQAGELFYDHPKISRSLALVADFGLGYITLGQATSTFSGGEAQRLKLLSLVKDVKPQQPHCLIFDEPSTGLSDGDLLRLWDQFVALRSQGHTLILIEHHPRMIASADHVIELGPKAGPGGGRVVFSGTPANLMNSPDSNTAQYIRD